MHEMIGDVDMFGSITYFVIVSDVDSIRIVANMAALVTGTLSSSRAFVNQIHCFVRSARPIYSALHVEVATDFWFLECQQIVELLSQQRLPKMLCRVSRWCQ
jgi:hypothetical protein